VRVTGDPHGREVFEQFGVSPLGEPTARGIAPQCVNHLDLEEVRHVQAAVRPIHPLSDARRARAKVQQHRYGRRGVQDDQRRLTEVTGVVGVAHPAEDHLRRLVYLDRLPAAYALQSLLHRRLLGQLL
jgi:hypothetical protein